MKTYKILTFEVDNPIYIEVLIAELSYLGYEGFEENKQELKAYIEVNDFEASLELKPLLETLGFNYRPDDDISDRHYFPRTINGLRKHHLSLAEPNSKHCVNSLAFRNALRTSKQLCRQYADLKRQLAADAGKQRLDYLNGKTNFILSVLNSCGIETDGYYPNRFGNTKKDPL